MNCHTATFMQKFNNKVVLLSPLDWGLGHTTRCIAIIRLLIDKGNTVLVACNHTQKTILTDEFPQLEFFPLEGYNIVYSKNKKVLPLKLLIQLPKLLSAIINEHLWLRKMVKHQKIDIIISDNRFGFYSKRIPCVFITHQLTIKAPFNWIESLLRRINYSFINRFAACWVPDFEGTQNIAGTLSHPKRLPLIPTQYIGPLTRFTPLSVNNESTTYDCCIIISGPEPQRSLLEKILLAQLPHVDKRFLLVRGVLHHQAPAIISPTNTTIVPHLKGQALNQAIHQSAMIITRSGYTSVMELLALQKKMIVIPTPGQTEQEYLAQLLTERKWAIGMEQTSFQLSEAMDMATDFPFQLPLLAKDYLSDIIDQTFAKL